MTAPLRPTPDGDWFVLGAAALLVFVLVVLASGFVR